jgi:hypothetical protein
VSSSDECSHRRPGERAISTSEWNRREDAALAEQDYELSVYAEQAGNDRTGRDRDYARSYEVARVLLFRFRAGGPVEPAIDALEEHIGAIAELGTIARLRSKLANLPDGELKTQLATLLED